MKQQAVSYHLRLLRERGLIKPIRRADASFTQ
ncbi:MAG: hypothetical protein J7J28_00550 [Thaumarchaeota archaeon]|nr:hypothetical protein [Nitrososphaerota archaeon]